MLRRTLERGPGRARRHRLPHGAHEWGLDRRAALVDGRRRRALRPAGGGRPWRSERRPCTTALSTSRVSSASIPRRAAARPVLDDARRPWNRHYGAELGERFRTAGLCLYRDGRDSVAWHGDTIGRASTEDTMVAIVSPRCAPGLAPAPEGWRPCHPPRARPRRPAGHGRSCQRTWEHAVPSRLGFTGARMSVQSGPEGCAEPQQRPAALLVMPRTHLPVGPVGGVLGTALLCATHQAKNLVSHGHDPSRRSRWPSLTKNRHQMTRTFWGFSPLRPGPRRTRLADPRPGTCNQIPECSSSERNTSSPCSREIKPKPFSALKNFTVPVANALSLSDRRPQTLRNAPKG